MKIIKRSGVEEVFAGSKIVLAGQKAKKEVPATERLSEDQIHSLAQTIEAHCEKMGRSLNVEEIQDLVENQIMER